MKTIMYRGNVDNNIIEMLGESQEAYVAIRNLLTCAYSTSGLFANVNTEQTDHGFGPRIFAQTQWR